MQAWISTHYSSNVTRFMSAYFERSHYFSFLVNKMRDCFLTGIACCSWGEHEYDLTSIFSQAILVVVSLEEVLFLFSHVLFQMASNSHGIHCRLLMLRSLIRNALHSVGSMSCGLTRIVVAS